MMPLIPIASLLQAFVESNATGQVIVIIQVVISMIVWTVMVGKCCELRRRILDTEFFRRDFTRSTSVLDIACGRNRPYSPALAVYKRVTAMLVRIARPEALAGGDVSVVKGAKIGMRKVEMLKSTAEEAISDESARADAKLPWVAFGAAVGPLLGLLGTVWGVLDAFQAMGAKGSAIISEVAPGLSSAMLTTVVGLFLAIPSACGYNIVVGLSDKLKNLIENFADEYIARMVDEFAESDY